MEEIRQLIGQYGLDTIVIAFIVNLLTAAIKMPIKALARKTSKSAQITRFIVFLPILLGFTVSFLYCKCWLKNYVFGKEFVTLWLSSSSLSLTFYAVFEKMLPVKASAQGNETELSRKLLDEIATATNVQIPKRENKEKNVSDEAAEIAPGADKAETETIILRGNGCADTEAEK